jgi:hypothetical protein
MNNLLCPFFCLTPFPPGKVFEEPAMRTVFFALVIFAAAPGLVPRALAAEKPKDIIRRAIEEVGGMERVALDFGVYRKLKGKLYQDFDSVFTAEIYQYGRERFRFVVDVEPGTNVTSFVQVWNGDELWMRDLDATQEAQGDLRGRMKLCVHVLRVAHLVALLRDKAFTLSLLDEGKVEARPALGVKVEFMGMPDVLLYFDKASGFLVKYEYKTALQSPNQQVLTYTIVFKDYKVMDDLGADEESLLKQAKLATDGRALLGYVRKQIVTPAVRVEIQNLVRELGSASFRVRRKATADLIARGMMGMPFLEQALKDADPEIVHRAKKCLARIKVNGAKAISAGVWLLGLRHPDGAVEALLDFLPSAPNADVAGEVRAALFEIARRSKTGNKSLIKALGSNDSVRRGNAAAALGRDGGIYEMRPGRRCYVPGLKLHQTQIHYRDGKLLQEMTVTTTRFYNKFDDTVFSKP